MLPTDFQDYVFQWSAGKVQHKELRDKLMALAMNRASLGRPAPTEVDRVWAGEEWEEDGGYWQEDGGNNESEEKVEVDFVGEMCMRCGGHGHYARECLTPKEKGKGKGGSKGKGKGKGNQYEYGKGKGKGGGKSGGGKGCGGDCRT